MVQLCSVIGCKQKAKHRIKSVLKKHSSINFQFSSRHEVLRICEAHYQSVSEKSTDTIPDIQMNRSEIFSDIDESMYENVEFLDVSYECMEYVENDEDHRDNSIDNICDNFVDLTDEPPRPVNYVYKVFLFLVLSVLFIANILTKFINRCNVFEKQINYFTKRIKVLQTENCTLRNALKCVNTKFDTISTLMKNLEESVGSVFNSDQINILKKKLKRPKKWSDVTILKALKIKFACRKRGYTNLINEGYPLPSLRVLRHRLQGIYFNPGILEDVFTFLKVKVDSFTDSEKECFLVIDELSIVEGEQYDIATQSFIGKATIPLAKSQQEVDASHALVFMIVGLSTRYKQIVGYDFTGNSTNGQVLFDRIMDIVWKSWNVGLKCNGMTSDMGGSNVALWKIMKIKATRKGPVTNYITHPCDPNRKFWIVADVPHLLKNIVQGLRNHNTITFDDVIVKAYDLPGNSVRCKDILELFDTQKEDLLKLAPKLKPHILNPNYFEKMNVPVSSNLIGSNVSTGLYYLYTELKPKERKDNTYLTTAWFCQIIMKWFKLMTARHSSLGINRENYRETVDTLNDLMEVMRHAKFGQDGKWKPFQRGFIVSTMSLLELSEFLLKERGFNFMLAGRLLQDCLENLFSVVRSGNQKKNALQIRDSIKQISISEYMSPQLRNSSYHWSDNEFISDFLTIIRQAQSENVKKMKFCMNLTNKVLIMIFPD